MTTSDSTKGGPDAILSTGADAPMSEDQERTLRELSKDAREPEAFSRALTQTEAARRITILRAKLKLMSEPPHTA